MSNATPSAPEYVTCDIYGRQPGTKEYKQVERDKSFVEYIKGRGFKIIPISEEDELHYANNFQGQRDTGSEGQVHRPDRVNQCTCPYDPL